MDNKPVENKFGLPAEPHSLQRMSSFSPSPAPMTKVGRPARNPYQMMRVRELCRVILESCFPTKSTNALGNAWADAVKELGGHSFEAVSIGQRKKGRRKKTSPFFLELANETCRSKARGLKEGKPAYPSAQTIDILSRIMMNNCPDISYDASRTWQFSRYIATKLRAIYSDDGKLEYFGHDFLKTLLDWRHPGNAEYYGSQLNEWDIAIDIAEALQIGMAEFHNQDQKDTRTLEMRITAMEQHVKFLATKVVLPFVQHNIDLDTFRETGKAPGGILRIYPYKNFRQTLEHIVDTTGGIAERLGFAETLLRLYAIWRRRSPIHALHEYDAIGLNDLESYIRQGLAALQNALDKTSLSDHSAGCRPPDINWVKQARDMRWSWLANVLYKWRPSPNTCEPPEPVKMQSDSNPTKNPLILSKPSNQTVVTAKQFLEMVSSIAGEKLDVASQRLIDRSLSIAGQDASLAELISSLLSEDTGFNHALFNFTALSATEPLSSGLISDLMLEFIGMTVYLLDPGITQNTSYIDALRNTSVLFAMHSSIRKNCNLMMAKDFVTDDLRRIYLEGTRSFAFAEEILRPQYDADKKLLSVATRGAATLFGGFLWTLTVWASVHAMLVKACESELTEKECRTYPGWTTIQYLKSLQMFRTYDIQHD